MRYLGDTGNRVKKSHINILTKKNKVNRVVLDLTKNYNRTQCDPQLVKRKNIEHNLEPYLQKHSINSTLVNGKITYNSNRIISLDSDLQLHPAMTKTTGVKSVGKAPDPITSRSIIHNQLVMELNDYLTLSEQTQGKFMLKLVSKDKAPTSIIQNLKSDKSDIKPKRREAMPMSQVINKPVKKVHIQKQAVLDKTTDELQESQKMFVLVPKENCATISKKSLIIQQPVDSRKLCIKAIPTASRKKKKVKTIKPKLRKQQMSVNSQPIPILPKLPNQQFMCMDLPASSILPKQPIICRPRPAITKRKSAKERQSVNEKTLIQGVKPLSLVKQYSKNPIKTLPSPVNKEKEIKQIFPFKTLPIVHSEKETNQIFPVALAPSDSYDFEYIQIFNNEQEDSETQILGI